MNLVRFRFENEYKNTGSTSIGFRITIGSITNAQRRIMQELYDQATHRCYMEFYNEYGKLMIHEVLDLDDRHSKFRFQKLIT